MKYLLTLCTLLISTAVALPSYTGYSGASGSKGNCSSTCHGSGTGTITIVGIPQNYVPLTTYTVVVKHTSGSTISNYNLSTRKASTSTVAGSFATVLNSSLYTVSGYESGVRQSVNNIDSSVFQWTAPAKGTGSVTFSLSGLQGSKSGAVTKLSLTVSEGVTGVAQNAVGPNDFQLHQNFPNPFNPSTVIRYTVPARGMVELFVSDMVGNVVSRLVSETQEPGFYSVPFHADLTSKNGTMLASGVYFYTLRMNGHSQTKKMVLVR